MGVISAAVLGGAYVATTDKTQRANNNDNFAALLNRVFGYVGSAFEVAANGASFIGLNYQKVEPIRSAIREYVLEVQKKLSELNTEASTNNALKGEIAVSAAKYVKAVSDVANAYVSALLAYSDKMYEYGMQFAKNDQSLKDEVDKEADTLTSEAESYVEKHNDVFKAPASGGSVGVGAGAGAAMATAVDFTK